MTNQELFERARAACNDYYKVFGNFPEKIGIRYDRLKKFPFDHGTLIAPPLTPVDAGALLYADIASEPVICHDLSQVEC